VTIARAIRRSFRLFPYFREDSNTGFEVSPRNIFDQLGSQVVSGVENFIEDRFRASLEMNGLAAAIFGRPTPLYPTIVLEAIEQTGECCALDPHALGDFFLGEFISALRKMHQRAPFALAQTERPQTLVELGAPRARGPEEDKAEFVDIWRRHGRELISVLTNPNLP